MPTTPISEARREEIRRQEWEDRDFAATLREQERAHELIVLERKQAHAEAVAKLKVEAAAAVKVAEVGVKLKVSLSDEKLRQVAVHAITLLQLCGRTVPQSLTDLLRK